MMVDHCWHWWFLRVNDYGWWYCWWRIMVDQCWPLLIRWGLMVNDLRNWRKYGSWSSGLILPLSAITVRYTTYIHIRGQKLVNDEQLVGWWLMMIDHHKSINCHSSWLSLKHQASPIPPSTHRHGMAIATVGPQPPRGTAARGAASSSPSASGRCAAADCAAPRTSPASPTTRSSCLARRYRATGEPVGSPPWQAGVLGYRFVNCKALHKCC